MGTGLTTYTTLTSARATLIKLLTIATKDQLFQFNGDLYKQIDGVAMGSPLGPLTVNTRAPLRRNLDVKTSFPISTKDTSKTPSLWYPTLPLLLISFQF